MDRAGSSNELRSRRIARFGREGFDRWDWMNKSKRDAWRRRRKDIECLTARCLAELQGASERNLGWQSS